MIAPADPATRVVTSRTVADVVAFAVALCKESGLSPSVAAVKAMDHGQVSMDALRSLATIGVASLTNDRLHNERGRNRRDDTDDDANAVPARRGSTSTEKRAALYAKVRGALASYYEGADGAMRRLFDFTADDHEHRLCAVGLEIGGLAALKRFHTESLKSMRAASVLTIGGLDSTEQRRLAGILS